MRLAIADPPYLGLAEMLYGYKEKAHLNFNGSVNQLFKADRHPEAHLWDDPDTHRRMVESLVEQYDGWAIAMLPRSLRHYLQWVPSDTRVAVWHDPRVMPTGSHPPQTVGTRTCARAAWPSARAGRLQRRGRRSHLSAPWRLIRRRETPSVDPMGVGHARL
jgi:hypothetical protein